MVAEFMTRFADSCKSAVTPHSTAEIRDQMQCWIFGVILALHLTYVVNRYIKVRL